MRYRRAYSLQSRDSLLSLPLSSANFEARIQSPVYPQQWRLFFPRRSTEEETLRLLKSALLFDFIGRNVESKQLAPTIHNFVRKHCGRLVTTADVDEDIFKVIRDAEHCPQDIFISAAISSGCGSCPKSCSS